ncbi:MBL fold metallo-hydrolase [Elioraea tepidiphila]|uniref:MBL fold metallo-hydrolase n=1 Tax=Elioraea tepidiphila TaxID=457934 RepID=UPI00037B7239|nr:MBL fold metallo-hydrolase [Elioraea tepidiphila]
MTGRPNRPEVRTFFHEPTNTAAHLVWDPTTKAAAIVDSVLDYDAAAGRTDTAFADRILAGAAEEGVQIAWILETHAHADHLSAAPYLKDRTGAPIGMGKRIIEVQKVFRPIFHATDLNPDGGQFDRLFDDEETFPLGNLTVRVLHTPGHTPACSTYVIGDAAFVGDTLFMPDYGTARADFPGGDARTLYRSIRRVLSLPATTRLFLCHDYKAKGRDHYAWETTVAEERSANVHVRDGITEDEFVAMREARDRTLKMPALIIPSIQVNMRAGRMPPPEEDGHVYLKVPVNRL